MKTSMKIFWVLALVVCGLSNAEAQLSCDIYVRQGQLAHADIPYQGEVLPEFEYFPRLATGVVYKNDQFPFETFNAQEHTNQTSNIPVTMTVTQVVLLKEKKADCASTDWRAKQGYKRFGVYFDIKSEKSSFSQVESEFAKPTLTQQVGHWALCTETLVDDCGGSK
jgi:hypothetical protein